MFNNSFVSHILVKKRFAFFATGETVGTALRRKMIDVRRVKHIYPADERISSKHDNKNLPKIQNLFASSCMSLSLNVHNMVNPSESAVIISVASDGHFASIWPNQGHLAIKGTIVRTRPGYNAMCHRLSLGYDFLMKSQTFFLFKDTDRFQKFNATCLRNSKLRALGKRSRFMLIV